MALALFSIHNQPLRFHGRTRYGEMGRKDFNAIASSLGAIHNPARREAEMRRIMPVLAKSNPRFNETRFREAVNKAARGERRRSGFWSGMMKLGLRKHRHRNSRTGRFTRKR